MKSLRSIASVGGNRYGWFDYNQFPYLAVDQTRLEMLVPVPEPATFLAGGLLLVPLATSAWRRLRKQ